MAGTLNCAGSRLPNTQVLRQSARDQLVCHLIAIEGKKDLVLDTSLMSALDRIAGASLLRENGVDKIFKLESGAALSGCEKRVYLVRPQPQLMRDIANQISAERTQGANRVYTILMVPRKLHVCELILEQEGICGYIHIDQLALDFIPLDEDILSLEMPHFFTSYFLDRDQTWLHTAAQALMSVQQVFGKIPNVYGLGKASQMVYELMCTMQDSQASDAASNPEINHLFIVDREADYITPLCSQVTYEGLLDETFTMKSGYIEFGPEVTGKEQSTKMLLTRQDVLYEEIQNKHFSTVSSILSNKAKQLQTGYDKRHNITSVRDMKDFVAKDLKDLKQQHKSLSMHVGACEVISKRKAESNFEEQLRAEHGMLEGIDMRENTQYIEEIINCQYEKQQSLRLLCLLSLTQGGLSSSTYKSLTTQFLQSYGCQYLPTLNNLKRLGILTEHEQSSASRQLGKVAAVANIKKPCNFRSLCKKISLIPKSADDVDLRNPNDMSYVFSGAYTPLLCKVIEQILAKDGMTALDDVLKLMTSPHFAKKAQSKNQGSSGPKSTPVVMVYFLGGCTYTEVTALRFLGKQRGYRFLVATTSMMNSASFINLITDL